MPGRRGPCPERPQLLLPLDHPCRCQARPTNRNAFAGFPAPLACAGRHELSWELEFHSAISELVQRSGNPVFIRRVLGRWFSGAKVYREVDDLDNKDWMVVRTE